MTGMVLDGGGSTGDAALGLLLLCGALTLAVGFPLSLWWRLRPGRVSYEVADGELCIYRGSKIVQRESDAANRLSVTCVKRLCAMARP